MNVDEIWELVQSIHKHTEDFSEGDLYDRIHSCDKYELVEVKIKDIDPDEWACHTDVVDKYSQLDPKTVPPIILHQYKDGHYSIVDGTHRINAFLLMKQKKIKAYVGQKR